MRKTPIFLLMLDFDGTLAPLRSRPCLAKLPAKTKKLLEKLNRKPNIILSMVSGRDIADLKRKIGIKGLIYAGSHGFDIEGGGIKFSVPLPLKTRNILQKLARGFAEETRAIKGVVIERKKFSVAFHYRNVGEKNLRAFDAAFQKVFEKSGGKGLGIRKGKKVIEVMPAVKWDKGKAVLKILRFIKDKNKTKKIIPIYIGDDITDERAFGALAKKGITIKVGAGKKTAAKFRLQNISKVYAVLSEISGL